MANSSAQRSTTVPAGQGLASGCSAASCCGREVMWVVLMVSSCRGPAPGGGALSGAASRVRGERRALRAPAPPSPRPGGWPIRPPAASRPGLRRRRRAGLAVLTGHVDRRLRRRVGARRGGRGRLLAAQGWGPQPRGMPAHEPGTRPRVPPPRPLGVPGVLRVWTRRPP